MKFYYFVNRGHEIFDIGWTYEPINFENSEKMINVFTKDMPQVEEGSVISAGRSWIRTEISDVYEKRQNFMKINNSRDSIIQEILN